MSSNVRAGSHHLAMVVTCITLISCTAPPAHIAIATDPPGASCDLLRSRTVIGAVKSTPGSVQVASTYPDITVVCRRAGFRDARFTREWSPGNILIGGAPGRAVDSAFGFDYGAPVYIRMQPIAPQR